MKVVCHIQLFSDLTGVQNVSLDEFKASLNSDKKVGYHLICKEDGDFSKAAKNLGVTVHHVPTLVRQISPANDLMSVYAIYKILKQIKCNVVHTHSSKPGILGRFAAYLAGVDCVVHTVHGFGFPTTKNNILRSIFFFAEFFAARFTDSLIVMNMSDYNYAKKYLRVDNKNLYLLSNSCRFQISSSLDQVFSCDLNLAFVGRLDEQKNPVLVIDSFAKLMQFAQFKNTHLYIVGDGKLKSSLILKVKNLGLDKSVTFCGWHQDPSDVLKKCKVLLCTSRWEGFPLVVSEGASFGCLPLMTNIPGYRELHDYHRIGYLSDENNYGESLMRLCNLIIRDENFWKDARNNLSLGFSTLPSSQTRLLQIYKCYETNN